MKPQTTLKERGIEKPQGSRAKAAKLNGTTAHAPKRTSKSITVAQRKAVIADWLYVVNFVEAVASNDFHAFAGLTMSHLQLIVAKIEPPPAKGSPSDVAVDEFSKSMAAMMVRVLTEVLTESDDEVRKRVMGGTVIEAIGPRPQGPRSKGDAYPVSMQERRDEKPLAAKQVHELESEEDFQAWLAKRQAREGAAT